MPSDLYPVSLPGWPLAALTTARLSRALAMNDLSTRPPLVYKPVAKVRFVTAASLFDGHDASMGQRPGAKSAEA
jgi:hypothetical protein